MKYRIVNPGIIICFSEYVRTIIQNDLCGLKLFCSDDCNFMHTLKKVKWSRYRPDVAQSVGRGIALLFHDRGTRRGWVISSTPRPHFTPGKDTVPILQEAGWAPGPVWTGGKSRPYRDSIPDRPARSSVAIPTELPDPPMKHERCWMCPIGIVTVGGHTGRLGWKPVHK